MSSTIDERVVGLRFDNKQFESGVKDSLDSLDKLNDGLNKSTSSSSKAFQGINNAANKTDLSGIAKSVEALSERFSTLGIVGMRVIQNITDGLMGGLSKAVHSVTDSVVSGGIKRAMDIENAHFQLQGIVGDEKEVKAIMDDALDSVDGTAYAYNEAAKAAGVFAASGLRSGPELQKALKGIAGVAATTNQEYERISDIFTKIAGKGKVQAIELNQLASAGLGAAATLTDFFNKVNDNEVETTDSVKASIKELTGGLEITEEELRDFVSGGAISFDIFSEAMATTFGDHAKDANQTFTGSMANIRAALARTGAMFVSPLIEQNGPFVQFFNAIRVKVNEFNTALGAVGGMAQKFTNWVNGMVSSLTPMIENFKIANTYVQKWGGGTTQVVESAHKSMLRWGDGTQAVMTGDFYTPFHAFQDIVYSVVNLFKALGSVIKPIASAFKEAFTFDSQGIYKSIEEFRMFTETLRLSEENSQNLHDAVKGVLDIFKTGIGIVTKFTQSLFHYNSGTGSLGNTFLELVGNAGRYLSNLSEMITKSEIFNRILKYSGLVIHQYIDRIKEFFTNISNTVMDKFNNDIKGSIHPLETLKGILSNIAGLASTVFGKIGSALGGIKNALTPIIEAVKPFFALVIKSLEETIQKVGPIKAIFQFINGTLLTGIMMKVNTILKRFQKTAGKPQGINKVLSAISKDLTELTKLIDAKALKEIAISIGILVASMYGIAALDPDKLVFALSAITILLFEMIKAFQKLSDMGGSDNIKDAFSGLIDSFKISGIGFALIEMAAAILILSRAIKSLGEMRVEDLAKGLIAITVLLFEMMVVVEMLSDQDGSTKMGSIGIGLILMAAGVGILTKSVKSLAALELENLIQGLISIGLLLLGLGAFVKVTGGAEKMAEIGFGMLILSAALKVIAGVIVDIGTLHLDQVVKGLIGMGVALAELMVVLTYIHDLNKEDGSGNGLLGDIAILLGMAIMMKSIAKTMGELASMTWESMARSLVAMGGAMGIFVGTLALIKKITGGSRWGNAGGVGVFATLVGLLRKPIADTIKDLGNMSWTSMRVALVAMGGSMAILLSTLYLLGKFKIDTLIRALAGTLLIALLVKKIQPIGDTLRKIGSLGWEGAMAGLAGLAGAILVLIVAMYVAGLGAEFSIPGAIAVAIICSKLEPVGKVLESLGNMNWTQIGHSMVALGGALLILIVAMYLAGLFAVVSIPGAIAVAIVAQALPPLGKGMAEIGSINWESIGAAMKAMAKSLIILIIAAALMKIVGDINWDTVKESFKKLVLTLTQLGLVTDAISGITDTDWAGVYAGFKDLLKTLGLLVIIGQTAGGAAMMGMGGAFMLATFGELLVIGMGSIIEAMDMVKKFDATGLQGPLNALAIGIAKLGLSLKTFGPFAGIGAGAMVKLGEAIRAMEPALKVLGSKETDPSKIGEGLKVLAGGFAKFGLALKTYGFFSGIGANAVLKLGQAIHEMAPALKTLTGLDPDLLSNTLQIIRTAFVSFGNALDAVPFWNPQGRAEGISALTDNITKLTEVLPDFMNLDQAKAKQALETIGGAFESFGAALDNVPFWHPQSSAEGILALVGGITDLTNVLPAFMELDQTKAATALGTLGNGFKNFGDALKGAPVWNPDERGEGIRTLVQSISTLTLGIQKFLKAGFTAEQFENTCDTIGTGFMNFGTALHSAPMFNPDERGEGIVTLVNSIETLVDGIKKFIEIDKDSETLKKILDELEMAFAHFGSAIGSSPLFKSKDRAAALIAVINSISSFVEPVKEFAGIGAETVGTILGAIGDGIEKIGKAYKSTPWYDSDTRAEGLTSVIASLDTLADVVIKLNALSLGDVVRMIGAISRGIGSISKRMNEFTGDAATNANTFDKIITSIQSLAGVDDANFSAVVTSFGNLVTNLTNAAGIDSEALRGFATALADTGKQGIEGFISAFSQGKTDAEQMVKEFIANVIKAITDKVDEFKNAGTAEVEAYNNAILDGSNPAVFNTWTAICQGSKKVIESWYPAFRNAGAECTKKYAAGLRERISEAVAAATALAQATIGALDAKDESGASRFYKAGVNAGEGYVNGLKSKLEDAKKVASDMASTASNATAKTQESRSPSRVFMRLGSYAGEGYTLGILKWAEDAYNAGKELAQAVDNSFNEFDLNEPVIRPIVDLTNVAAAASSMNSMFNSAMMSTMSNTSAASSGMSGRVFNNAEEFQNAVGYSNGNTYNFVQNNNSPKELSRIDIYRDTKTLFRQFREAVDIV